MFHSFSHSFVLSISPVQEAFHCRLEATPHPTGGVRTISYVGCRQDLGGAEGLAHTARGKKQRALVGIGLNGC